MIVTIHQPDFLPWLGFFDRWRNSDLYIILDDVQFIRRGWQHRDKIKTSQGIKWLTVSVIKRGNYFSEIRHIQINTDSDWKNNHFKMIENAYSKSINFCYVFECLKQIYSKKHSFLIDLNIDLLKFSAKELNINTPYTFSSSLKIKSNGTQRLVDLVKAVGGNEYLSGLGSKDYLDENIFRKNNINVLWHNFQHPIYKQLYGDFEKNLSILDFLFNKDDD